MKFPARLLGVFLSTSLSFAHAIDTYIVAGQSNGWRLSQIVPAKDAPDATEASGPRIHYFGMSCVEQPGSSEMVTITRLNPDTKGAALAQALLDRANGEDIVFLQYCRCGAPVTGKKINSWWPGEDPQKGDSFDEGLFGLFESYWTKARAQSQSLLGEDLEVRGLFWHQGESNIQTDAEELEGALKNVFWRFRHIVGDPALPIAAGYIRDLGEGPAKVNATLNRISAADPHLETVPLVGIDFEPDRDGKPDVHIATSGCHKLGRDLVATMTRLEAAGKTFHAYAPSRKENRIWVIKAEPQGETLRLEARELVPLDFSPATITSHPFRPLLYVSTNRGADGVAPGATLTLSSDGSGKAVTPFTGSNGYSYLSLDRAQNFLLACNYVEGFVDVYELDEKGLVGARVSSLNEGRKAAHCVLPSPDNRSVYIPYVKNSNALFQYHFDSDTGALTAMEKLDAEPPAGTGPRHLAYHPTLPILYFSNEQHLGVSVYDRAKSGQLSIRQVCDLAVKDIPEDGVSSSDIVITPDGRFIFAGIRGQKHDFDFISRYEVLENGELKALGVTPADSVPWGLALSPDGRWLLATGFKSGTLMAYRVGSKGELTRAGTLEWDENISDIVTR